MQCSPCASALPRCGTEPKLPAASQARPKRVLSARRIVGQCRRWAAAHRGTGPRRGWHWPAAGMALARRGEGTGPGRGWRWAAAHRGCGMAGTARRCGSSSTCARRSTSSARTSSARRAAHVGAGTKWAHPMPASAPAPGSPPATTMLQPVTGPGSPLPHLHQDRAHPAVGLATPHICAGTGLTPVTYATRLGSPLRHLRPDLQQR